MNIFILFLVALFMAGYFLMDSPSQNIAAHDTDTAVATADLRSIAQCTAAAHNAMLNGDTFDDFCVTQNNITSQQICLNNRGAITKCEIVRRTKPDASFVITIADAVPDDRYNAMMEILGDDFPDVGTFGIYQDGKIISGGTTHPRSVPKNIVSNMKIANGQLVYLTQYEMPDADTEFAAPDPIDIKCPVGTVATYRFSRWQCIGINTKTNCAGDMIWDSELLECVPDESRKPLCAEKQTAVMIDDIWECVNPFPDKACGGNMVARLNYSTLEWECVDDPTITPEVKKCTAAVQGAVYGPLGATLRIPTTSCTDCEKMITNADTCVSACVPDPDKLSDPRCYAGGAHPCDGPNQAFYFGFPNRTYVTRVSAVANYTVPIDAAHSQNRRFNCMDCGARGIDATRSLPPYIVVCNPGEQ